MTSENTYVPLTDAYRPYDIGDLMGQDHAKRKVGAWLRTNRVPNTILISGQLSAGKTSLARIVARTSLCHEPSEGNACRKCRSCKAFDAKNHPDYIEMNSASDRGIDAMRNIAIKIRMKPMSGPRKVLVLDEAHGITSAGWGALLKPMEEPPVHMVIILVTTNPEKIPQTNLSRCSIIRLDDFSYEDCTDLLVGVAEKIGLGQCGITKDHLGSLARAVRGHPRNALHALDQVYTMVLDAGGDSESVDTDLVDSFIQEVASSDVEAAAAAIAHSILHGKPGKALKQVSDCSIRLSDILQLLAATMQQAVMRSISPKLGDPYYDDVFDGVPIMSKEYKDSEMGGRNRQEVLVDAYRMFSDLIVHTSDRPISLSEVISEPVARSGLLIKRFMKRSSEA